MKIPEIIAIDGPAASGKSTAGRLLAERFGYLYFDTGVLYRAVTWSALQNGVAVDDEEGIVQAGEGGAHRRAATVERRRQGL